MRVRHGIGFAGAMHLAIAKGYSYNRALSTTNSE
jgi:hypothetical protein